MKLLAELRSPKKGLINIKNSDQKCFLWCHIRHINPVKVHPERTTKENKKLVKELDYDYVDFPVKEKDFSKIETKNNICINVFCYKNRLTFPIYVSDQKFENLIDLLLKLDDDKSHYMYVKDFNRFMFNKTKLNKSFSSKNVLMGHKEGCSGINGTQSVKLEEETIEFTKYFKHTSSI